MDRTEHVQWCKQRALEYVDSGDFDEAMASMCSDLGKHPDTVGHAGIPMGIAMMTSGQLDSDHEMRKFINGFN